MRIDTFNSYSYEYNPSGSIVPFTESSRAQAAAHNGESKIRKVHSLEAARGIGARQPIVACLVGSLLLMLAMFAAPTSSAGQVSFGIAVSFGPPAIPIYVQPPCPAAGYIWTPGYWAWDPDYGYYWVPGTWVAAPFVGALWTPGYWGWYNSGYVWYPGYWGTAVGFYGGINYGYGYTGFGYYGGYWNRGRFYYNRDVNHITNIHITNVYNQRVVENVRVTRVSYNGGPGGISARPSQDQLSAARTRRFGAINQQVEQEHFARTDPVQRASYNHGRPDIAATPRPGEFKGHGVVRASRAGAPYKEPPREVQGAREAARPVPGNSRNDRGFQSFGAPRATEHSAPVERRAPAAVSNERPAPGHAGNDRGFQSFGAPRAAEPNAPVERRSNAPVINERPAPGHASNDRGFQPFGGSGSVERGRPAENRAPAPAVRNTQPVYRNNQAGGAERNQRVARPPEPPRAEGRGPVERPSHPSNNGQHEGGNGHGPGGGRR